MHRYMVLKLRLVNIVTTLAILCKLQVSKNLMHFQTIQSQSGDTAAGHLLI